MQQKVGSERTFCLDILSSKLNLIYHLHRHLVKFKNNIFRKQLITCIQEPKIQINPADNNKLTIKIDNLAQDIHLQNINQQRSSLRVTMLQSLDEKSQRLLLIYHQKIPISQALDPAI
jgi:hypothetical protein